MAEGPPVAARRAGLAEIRLIKVLVLCGVAGTGGSLRHQRRRLARNWASGGGRLLIALTLNTVVTPLHVVDGSGGDMANSLIDAGRAGVAATAGETVGPTEMPSGLVTGGRSCLGNGSDGIGGLGSSG